MSLLTEIDDLIDSFNITETIPEQYKGKKKHKYNKKNKQPRDKKTKKQKKKKQIKWRIGDTIQYNSDPEYENDTNNNLETKQGIIKDFQTDNGQISILQDDNNEIHNYFIDDITIIYNISKSGHPKTTYGSLLKHHKEMYEDQIDGIKNEIYKNRQAKDKKSVSENRQKLKELKSQIKTERNEIKRQTHALRKKYKGKDDDKFENQHIEEKDCWEVRLPNMQQFIINIQNNIDKKTDKQLRNILKDYKNNKINSSNAIQYIKDWIDLKMPNALPYATKPKDMSKIISNLGKNITEILQLILTDENECKAICNRSYHHDLFEKIVLMTGKKGWKLRLHLFKEDNLKEVQEELHSHRNHFLSTCLYGEITQKVWEMMKKNENENDDNKSQQIEETNELYDGKDINYNGPIYLHKYTYDPKGDEKNRKFNIVKHKEKVKMICVKKQTSKVGDMYYMHPSVIHQVVQCHGKTITLVLNSKTVMLKSCFGTYQQWHSEQFKRLKFKTNELNEVLGLAVKLVGK